MLIPESDGTVAYDVSEIAEDYNPAFWSAGWNTEPIARRGPAQVQAASALPVVDLLGVRLGPPIAKPPKIICIGLNYHDHAAEPGMNHRPSRS